MSPAPAVISFDNVSKSYGGAAPVLDRVSLDVRAREFLAIVGPSGSGKTTLLRLVNRLIDPSDGAVRVEGEDVRSLDAVNLRRRIGYVFQGVGLFPHMTVAENIAITPKLLGWDAARMAARVDALLDLVRLDRSKHRGRFPAELSGGEGQRVGVARAIAAEPRIVLMDEPFGALDPLTRDALGEDYRRLHDELGLTSVMITHDMLEALLLADRIAVIRNGGIVAQGTPQALMNAEQDDYVRELMATPRRQAERLRKLGSAMSPQLTEALARLPAYLGGHVAVSVTALLLGLTISLPLALVSMRRPGLRNLLLGLASIVQTIPSLALLALFYPLLLGLSALCERAFGAGFSALGFPPSVLALTLYSMLPVLRNTITGLQGINPAIGEAALGVGMTRRQSLLMVELPLALPVIMAGIRTAAIWVIGAATLSTPIGQTSLGNYIFTGLQTQNWVFVLFGCTAAAVFALAVDQLLALMEMGLTRRRRGWVMAGGLGLVLLTAAALVPALSQPRATYAIGAKPFAEQYVLAALIEQRLSDAGWTAATRDGLGSSVIFNALRAGEIDAYVDYSGTIWTNQMHRSDVKPREEVLTEMAAWLEREHGIRLLGGLGFENAYALAMPRARAQSLGIKTLADLAGRAQSLSIAGDYEFFGRPEWDAVRKTYGISFREQRQMQPEFMYEAVAHGEVDVIAGYTSDGRIAQLDLAVLDDPKHAIPPYDAVLLISPQRANDTALLEALRPLVGSIDVATMREANLRASGSPNASPREAARWLWSEILRKRGTSVPGG